MIAKNRGTGWEWLAASAIAAVIVASLLIAFLNRGLG